MARLTAPLLGLLDRAVSIGSTASDDAEGRLRKSALLLTAWSVVVLASVWVLVYLALDRPVSAAIPLAYQVVTLASIVWVWRRGWTERFKTSQVLLMLVLPSLLMWSLGGFVPGSAAIIWGFVAPMGALIFIGTRAALLTFGGFVAFVLVSAVLDPWLNANVEPVSDAVVRTFFVLNILAVAAVAFGATLYFVFQRDRAQAELARALADLDRERARSDALLRNILPDAVAERLKDGQVVADRYEAVTVLFADIVGFTPLAAALSPEEIVRLLDGVYGGLDEIAAEHGLVRIKTMGDAYMAAAGVPDPMPAADGARAAVAMAQAITDRIHLEAPDVEVRVGLHTGPAVAGVIGRRTFAYDLWGDAVNIASRMESQGIAGRIQVSAATHDLVRDAFRFSHRGQLDVKGVGLMDTYLLETEPKR